MTGRFNVNNRRHPFHYWHHHQHSLTICSFLFLAHDDEDLSPECLVASYPVSAPLLEWLVWKWRQPSNQHHGSWNWHPYQHHWWVAGAVEHNLEVLWNILQLWYYKILKKGKPIKKQLVDCPPFVNPFPLPPQFQPLFCTNRSARTP